MWEDNMKSWPPIGKPDIVFYLVHSKACDFQEVSVYKSLESYLYLTSGLVGTVLHHRISEQLGYFKAEVGRSQSFNAAAHKAWACVHTKGRVVTGGCSCIAGQAKVLLFRAMGGCVHDVAQAPFKLRASDVSIVGRALS
ncbi:hypothetical protein HPB47_019137 [Ixodes persulcatus]|uniref:Uncharacterized protein n=1 Tax=Ixodes persulcatus TaxID=34615 RepID=A0AC60QIY3_IXOPE|nr:hypothetical protein HPB47_019137 [Ixodes persulcatus]